MKLGIAILGLIIAFWALFLWRGAGVDNPVPLMVAAAGLAVAVTAGVAEVRMRLREGRSTHG